jgi:hypothetical protein
MVITREIATKVRDVVDVGLVRGVGDPEPGRMCVEAAVCYALGLPHGDEPGCVSPALRRLKIGLNDRAWSSDQARAKGLRRLAIAQLGSAGALDDREFMRRVAEMTIRRAVPVGLRAAAKLNPKNADKLEAAAVRCEHEGTREACKAAQKIASASAYAAYAAGDASAYAYAAYAAGDASAYDASAYDASAYAADASASASASASAYAAGDASASASAYAASAYAAYAAASASAYAASAYAADASASASASAAYAAGDASASAYAYAASASASAADAYAARARDRVLAEYAEWIVEILIDMQAPGCQWLDLTPKDEAA